MMNVQELLASRPRRCPDYVAEIGAHLDLTKELARDPSNLCQRLAELALGLCRADSIGVSVLNDDRWRWAGLAGLYSIHRHEMTSRPDSPATLCLGEQRTQLLAYPDRTFPALAGEPRFVELLLVPFGVRAEPIGVVWVASHTTRRQLDSEDERLVRSLSDAAAVGWRLWLRQEALLASIVQKDTFVAMLGHELRHPLAAIAASSAILSRLAAEGDDVLERAAEVLGRQSRYLCRLVDDLNDLSRIDHGKLDVRLQRVLLAEVVEDAVCSVLPRVERRRQRLLVSVPSEGIELRADPVRIAQILVNLLDNATKYTADGGEIQLSAAVREQTVQLIVRDTGLGIPSDKLVAIFDAFTQITPPAGRAEGLGLGLALAQRLVSLHGGTIHAASAGIGRGSEFTVRLPVQQTGGKDTQMAGLPRCAVCRTTIEARQPVTFRPDGRVQHTQCPGVTCPVCDGPVLPNQPIRRDGDRIIHGNCWLRFGAAS